MMDNQVIIVVEKGIVQAVYTNHDMTYQIVDLDINDHENSLDRYDPDSIEKDKDILLTDVSQINDLR